MYYVCMARVNVYVPDDLAARARAAGLNVSAVAQAAIRAELERNATDAWLRDLPRPSGRVRHEAVQAALDEARAQFGQTA